MTQQDKAGEHRHREGELGFKPPDIERGNQRADDGAQRRIAAQKNSQQPVPAITPVRSADGRDGTKGRRDAFATFKTEEYGPDVADTGGDGNKPQPERGNAQRIRAPDG